MSEQLTEKQAAELLAANRLGFTTHVVGMTNDPAKAEQLLKQATARHDKEVATIEKRAKLATTILESLKPQS